MDSRIDAFEIRIKDICQMAIVSALTREKNGIVLLTPFTYSCRIQFKLRMLLASESLTFSEAYKVRSFNQKINLLFDTFRLNGVDDCLIQMDETDKTFIPPAHKRGKWPKNAEPIHSKHCRMKGMLLSISENHHVNEASTAQTNWKLCQFISEPFSKIARKHVLYEIKHVISKHDILNVWLRNSMWWNEWVFSLILCVLGPRCPYVTVNIACSIHLIRCNTVKIKSYSFVGAVAWKFGHFQKAFDKRNWCFRNTNRITELNGMILTSSTMCVIKD